MATFYGGEQLASVQTFLGNGSNTSDSYQIPSGSYAIAHYSAFGAGGGVTIQGRSGGGADIFYQEVSVLNETLRDSFYLDEGDQVLFSAASASDRIRLVVEVFTKP